MNRAAVTPITAAAVMDCFVKNPFGILGFLSLERPERTPDRVLAGRERHGGDVARRFPTTVGPAVYTARDPTTVGRSTTSSPSPCGYIGQ
jgi:hypothetical protein